jgi:hypothetical protein
MGPAMVAFLRRHMLLFVLTLAAIGPAAITALAKEPSPSFDVKTAVASDGSETNEPVASTDISENPISDDNGLCETPHCDCLGAVGHECDRTWTVDYRVQTFCSSHTSFQFGSGTYAPLSKLDWSLDSTWQGLRVGLEKPCWDVHFQWLTPMTEDVYGEMVDSDWSGPNRDVAVLSRSPERWREGQNVELEGSYLLSKRCLGLPIEVWPTAGFRFQRFSMMAHNGLQVINDGTFPYQIDIPSVGFRWPGDMISFNQQYYMSYIGGQLRTSLNTPNGRPVAVIFQGDWAGTWGYNVDHHISGYENQGIHSFCMDTTAGGALHLSISAETPLCGRVSIGVQADHTEIRTTGSHRDLETGARSVDSRSTDGVYVKSDQTSLTGYLRARY